MFPKGPIEDSRMAFRTTESGAGKSSGNLQGYPGHLETGAGTGVS